VIGLNPLAHPSPSYGDINVKVSGSLTGLSVGNAVFVVQARANSTTTPTAPSGLSAIIASTWTTSVTSNNSEITTEITDSYRISFGIANASPITNASTYFKTGEVINRTGSESMSMALARSNTGVYTPTGLIRPIGYATIAWYVGSTYNSTNFSSDPFGSSPTIDGVGPTSSRFYTSGLISTVVAVTNTRRSYIKARISVWETDNGLGPISYSAGYPTERLYVLSGT